MSSFSGNICASLITAIESQREDGIFSWFGFFPLVSLDRYICESAINMNVIRCSPWRENLLVLDNEIT